MKKILISIVIILILIVIFVISNIFGITKVQNFNGETETMFYLKTKNTNTWFNFVKKDINELKINDLVLYKNPIVFDDNFSRKQNILGRLVAKAGDKFEINKAQVFLNDEILTSGENLHFVYRITMTDTTDFNAFLKDYNLKIKNIINAKSCDFISTQQVADELQNNAQIVNLRKVVKNLEKYSYDIFPFSPYYFWDTDNFGPVTLPQKGKTITLNLKNHYLYQMLINNQENNIMILGNAIFTINDKITNQYTFKKNYYFILNDNRHETNDSRSYGFIPEDQIVGKIL